MKNRPFELSQKNGRTTRVICGVSQIFAEAEKIMRYLVLCRLGVTKHIAAPRLGARAAATSYNPVRCATYFLGCFLIFGNYYE